jgi:hypothetical protein
MRQAYGCFAAKGRQLVLLALALGMVLSACRNDKKKPPEVSLDDRITAYQLSLKAELDWLWANMVYTQAHPSIDAEHCAAKQFTRKPVSMSDKARANDDLGGKMVDQLDYAAGLLDAARTQWDNFCGNRASASDTIAFLNSRLSAANQTLDFVKDTLDLRAKSRASG